MPLAALAVLALQGCVAFGSPPPSPSPPSPPPSTELRTIGAYQYAGVRISSPSARAFYFVMADLWEGLGPDQDARRRTLLSEPSFGPYDVGSRVWLRLGQQYRLTPECQGAPKWENTIMPVIDAAPTRTVSC